VRYALAWRTRFLATMAMTHSVMAGARNAKVSPQTVALHRREDPDFETQVVATLAHAIELLHDVTMRSAIEGDCEPVFWQGIEVGHIRKFDNRLRVELLRAHLPHRFKTPGAQAPLVAGDNNQVLIIDAATRAELVRLRQEALEAMEPKEQMRQMAHLPGQAADCHCRTLSTFGQMAGGCWQRVPRRKEGWVKPIASMPQISRVSEGWAYDACPRLRG
jgi:hypothetical protein